MINRELQQVTVKVFRDIPDAYGQIHKNTPEVHYADMVIKTYNQQNVTSPEFLDVTDIGLTDDSTIVEGNEIATATNDYLVSKVIPSFRYHQVFMKKKW